MEEKEEKKMRNNNFLYLTLAMSTFLIYMHIV